AMLLEVPLVLGRTSEGKVFAMRDSCPHRGIPLSYGRLDGKVVACCYHYTAVVRTARRQSGGVLLPRVAVRCVQRAVRGDSIALQPGQAESGADLCGALSLRRARRVCLGLYE